MSTDTNRRGMEKTLLIKAPVSAVWQALTNARELERWFPHQATVDEGVGGTLKLQWGEDHLWELHVEVWEHEKHLRLEYEQGIDYRQIDENEKKESLFIESSLQLAVDYFLEGEGGETKLRLVHNGFSKDENWDDLFDGVSRGWSSELQNLKLYLEHHRGQNRRMIFLSQAAQMNQQQVWHKLMGPEGFRQSGSDEALKDGQPFEFVASSGESYNGEVLFANEPLDFVGRVFNLNNAMLRIKSDHFGKWPEAYVILCCYDLPQDECDVFEQYWRSKLKTLFPN